MSLQAWLLYALAVFVLTATPGPAVLMCVTSGVHHGARRTFFSAAGSATAVLGIMACSAVGLGAVLTASEHLFGIIKWVGVGYLFYLGLSTLRSSTASFDWAVDGAPAASRLSLYVKGLLVGASNPKALLFFTAFFPQFINPAAEQLPQFLVMGATFVGCELFCLMFYASFAASIAPWLRVKGRARLFNRISGSIFLAASALLATVKRSGAA